MKNGRYAKPGASVKVLAVLVALLLVILLALIAIVILATRPTGNEEKPPQETFVAQTLAPPTEEPTMPPTDPPTEPPTDPPTEPPTEAPTDPPTEAPTEEPTEEPTEPPTQPPTEATAPIPEDATAGEQAAAVAKNTLGALYELGGNGPDTFDTSGLIWYCFNEIGVTVPRTVSGQATSGVAVDKSDLLPGDVVFFWMYTEGEAQYPGIYIGNGKFIAARNSSNPVTEFSMNTAYFKERYVTARRYWD